MNQLQQFVDFCRSVQPQSHSDVRRFFEGVVFFPYDDELLLQAFLFLNLSDYFPHCDELLLFEKSPNGENTDQGKCDFVYLSKHDRLVLIETKFINTQETGRTHRTRRTNKRGKVFQQAIELRQKFSDRWQISPDQIDCCVFATEDLTHREEAKAIDTQFVSIAALNQWQQDLKRRLESG